MRLIAAPLSKKMARRSGNAPDSEDLEFSSLLQLRRMERVNGVAPSSRNWQSRILLLNHTRIEIVVGFRSPTKIKTL